MTLLAVLTYLVPTVLIPSVFGLNIFSEDAFFPAPLSLNKTVINLSVLSIHPQKQRPSNNKKKL